MVAQAIASLTPQYSVTHTASLALVIFVRYVGMKFAELFLSFRDEPHGGLAFDKASDTHASEVQNVALALVATLAIVMSGERHTSSYEGKNKRD